VSSTKQGIITVECKTAMGSAHCRFHVLFYKEKSISGESEKRAALLVYNNYV
jgi:hypothetical protein